MSLAALRRTSQRIHLTRTPDVKRSRRPSRCRAETQPVGRTAHTIHKTSAAKVGGLKFLFTSRSRSDRNVTKNPQNYQKTHISLTTYRTNTQEVGDWSDVTVEHVCLFVPSGHRNKHREQRNRGPRCSVTRNEWTNPPRKSLQMAKKVDENSSKGGLSTEHHPWHEPLARQNYRVLLRYHTQAPRLPYTSSLSDDRET